MSTHQSFAALRHPGFRMFFLGNATAMLADNMEHVITYWVMFQKFHSPALSGFAVISHWLPYLLFAVPVGALADRVDPRRMIQLGMLLFMSVSLAWGILIATDTLQIWHAMILLIVHGIAGVFWVTPAQLLLHDIVGAKQLQSAVRSNATARYVGTMLGPAVGSGLMLVMTPAHALFVNMLIYLPLFTWLLNAPYGPKFRATRTAPRAMQGFADVFATLRSIADNHTMLSMTLLAGLASMFIGIAYQPQMPGFASLLGHGDPGVAYAVLLAADATGSLVAGLLLESRGLLPARPTTAFVLAGLWSVSLATFALSSSYPLAIAALFAAGFLELAFGAMAQTLVQLQAPVEIRGRVIGVFAMSALGMRMFSGITVGLMGEVVGIRGSLSMSAGLLLLAVIILYWWGRRAQSVTSASVSG
jgi:MFS family permease